MPEVRAFSRHDRDDLATLVNRHIGAVLPGGAVPVSTLLSHMERDTDEYILDPWVVDRHTIVGVHKDRVVAAAHLKRYGVDDRVSDDYRNAGDVDWFVCNPNADESGRAVLAAALAHLRRWEVRVCYAGGKLPCLGVYGVPDAWPHVQALLAEAGYDDAGGQIEVILAGDLVAIAPPGAPPLGGLELRRVVGPWGTSFEALLGAERVGLFEVDDGHAVGNAHLARWADTVNHWVAPSLRGQGIGTWLFRQGCAWLRMGGKERILAYAIEQRAASAPPMELGPTGGGCEQFYRHLGLDRISRTRRGWRRQPGHAG